MAERLNKFIISSFEEFSKNHNDGKLPMFKNNNNFSVIKDNINKLSKDVKDIQDIEDSNDIEMKKVRKELKFTYDNELNKLKETFDKEINDKRIDYQEKFQVLLNKEKINTEIHQKRIRILNNETNDALKNANINKYNRLTDNDHKLFKLKLHYDQVEENYIKTINNTNKKRKGRIKSNTLEKDAKNLLYTRDRKKEIDKLEIEIANIKKDIIELHKKYESDVLPNKKALAEQTIKFNNLVNTANKQNKESAEKLKKTNSEMLLGIEHENTKVTQKNDTQIARINKEYKNKLKEIDLEMIKEDFTNTDSIKQDAFIYSETIKKLEVSLLNAKSKRQKRIINRKEKKYSKSFLKKNTIKEKEHKIKIKKVKDLKAVADFVRQSKLEIQNHSFYSKIDKLKAKKELINEEFENNIKLLRINHLQILERLKWQTTSRKDTYNKQFEHLILNYEFDKKELNRKLDYIKKDLYQIQQEIKHTCEYNKSVTKYENEKIRINHLLFIEKNKHLNRLNHTNNIYHGNMSTIKKDMHLEIEDINSVYTKNINEGILNYYNKLDIIAKSLTNLENKFTNDSLDYELNLIEYKYERDKDLLSFDFNKQLLTHEKASVISHRDRSTELIFAIDTSFKSNLNIIEKTAKVFDNKSFNLFFTDISLYYNNLKKKTIDDLVTHLVEIINNRIIFETENSYFTQEQKALDTFNNNKDNYNSDLIKINTKIVELANLSNSLTKKKSKISHTIKKLKLNKKTKIDRTIFSGYIKNLDQLNKDIKDATKKIEFLKQKKDRINLNNNVLTKSFHNDLKDINLKLKKEKAYYFNSIDKIKILQVKYKKVYNDKLLPLTNYLSSLKKKTLKEIINQYFDNNQQLSLLLIELSNKFLVEIQLTITKDNSKRIIKIEDLYSKNLQRLKLNYLNIKKVYLKSFTDLENENKDIYYSLSNFNKLMNIDRNNNIDSIKTKYSFMTSSRKNVNTKDINDILNDLAALYSNEISSNTYIKNKIYNEYILLKKFKESKESRHHIDNLFKEELNQNKKVYKELHTKVNVLAYNKKIENDQEKQTRILNLNNQANEITKLTDIFKRNTQHEYKKITDKNLKKNESIYKELQAKLKNIREQKDQI